MGQHLDGHEAATIYLDNAATSWPKPDAVGEAMAEFLRHSAGNPGRGGHRLSTAASRVVEEARAGLARLINAEIPERVILTHGCTDSSHLAIAGRIEWHRRQRSGVKAHVVASSIEHNAALRCLHLNHEIGLIDLTIVECDDVGRVDPKDMIGACREETTLVCLSHASNAIGTIQPINEIGWQIRHQFPHTAFMVDAAQTAGHLPIDVQKDAIDLLAIAGHKGLRGPTGTGALYMSPKAYPDDAEQRRIVCPRMGGTSIRGFGVVMPTELPFAFEGGTLNAVGFAGLLAAMQHHDTSHFQHELDMTMRLIGGLNQIPGVQVYGIKQREGRTGVVLFGVEGVNAREAADALDRDHGICVRGGTHCAPLLFERLEIPSALRASPGPMTTADEIDALINAVRSLAAGVTVKPVVSETAAHSR